jgi:adenosylcobalamin-dependent ribonucleoside-triphosphate reductase
MDPTLSFQLNKTIVNELKRRYPNPFEGKSSISVFTFMRTYSRNIYDLAGNYIRNESFFDVCLRCVNGCMSLAKDSLGSKWDEVYWTPKAKRMMELFLEFKILPSGRNLWALGTELVHTKKMGLSLFNCTFHTSKNIDVTKSEFFCYIMDALMLGAGVGYDSLGSGKINITCPETAPYQVGNITTPIIRQLKNMRSVSLKYDVNGVKYLDHELNYIMDVTATHRNQYNIHVVIDTREGWVDALRTLLNSYFNKDYITIFDYTKVRPAGLPLKTFGGMSSGPQPLAEGLAIIRYLLQNHIGKKLDDLLIADICNILAMIVVSGNVRRSSQIFTFTDPAMCKIKNWELPEYKYRTMKEAWAYNSNNSFMVTDDLTDDQYADHLDNIVKLMNINGEPGIFNRDVARRYGRIVDGPTDKDTDIDGPNPCGEICLEGTSSIASDKPGGAGGELCNLVEIIMPNIKSIDEFIEVCQFGLFITKMISTVPIHWKGTDEIQRRNHRLGISQTGIIEFLSSINYNYDLYAEWLDTGYQAIKEEDKYISNLFGLDLSIKYTTIKPSGTLSLVTGVSSGMHPIRSQYFIRRIRIAKNKTDLINVLRNNGIHVEDDVMQANTTVVASFPIKYSSNVRTKEMFTFNEQAKLLLLLQKYWADNSVSCTLEFKEHEMEDVKRFLLDHREEVKGAAFLPVRNYTYPQLPQETIDEQKYIEMFEHTKPLNDKMFLTGVEQDEEELDNYCTGESCSIKRIK